MNVLGLTHVIGCQSTDARLRADLSGRLPVSHSVRSTPSAPSFHASAANFVTIHSGLSLPDSHTAFRYRAATPGPTFQPRRAGVMNKEWNNSDWFVEWLKLARNKGNKR
jgi:hypothetical protein